MKQVGKFHPLSLCLSLSHHLHALPNLFSRPAEREGGRLRDEMKKMDLGRTDLKEKLNVYEVEHYTVKIHTFFVL